MSNAQQITLRKGRTSNNSITSFVARLPLEEAFRVTIAHVRPTRSDAQNRYLWGAVYPAIQKALPEITEDPNLLNMDDETLHELMLGTHFGWKRIFIENARKIGEDLVLVKPQRTSSRLNKQEFADFVMHIQQYWAERGIYVPDPNEEL